MTPQQHEDAFWRTYRDLLVAILKPALEDAIEARYGRRKS